MGVGGGAIGTDTEEEEAEERKEAQDMVLLLESEQK